ncbi:efflux RND transporter periplasmic adaptor subunit [Paracoccus sediminicola]|uniref:efflux RND transporter periplasmic adaptor subunit n=1 Tax=Paracoccus sediminicola TaxID=3017783 RepID=UPI0022EFE3F1|nr:efflux RND transporter periplasmic adaptor subunit [Paracoccus sediminicola]WBU56749.1 efflux RND transporter periplasmic adaptor subunit [Paracoccus sediminicola]
MILAAYFVAASLGFPRAASAEDVLPVELIEVASHEVGADLRLTGTLEALDNVALGFGEGGRILDVLATEGDEFTKGEVLARIDPLQLQQALNAAEASLAAATAIEEQARQASERASAMLERGVGTRAARDAARQELSAAETRTRQAKSALDKARRSLDDTRLIAPFDGVVTAKLGEAGQVVGAAQPILSLASDRGIEAVFLTPDAAHLDEAMGKSVALRMLDFEAAPMMARITEIAPLVDTATGSVLIRASVEDAPENLSLLGASVRGTLNLSGETAIEIPWTALNSDGDAPAVWRVGEDGIATLTPVEVERFDNGTVLLSAGLAAGDIVVGDGSQLLFPGRRVVAAEVAP